MDSFVAGALTIKKQWATCTGCPLRQPKLTLFLFPIAGRPTEAWRAATYGIRSTVSRCAEGLGLSQPLSQVALQDTAAARVLQSTNGLLLYLTHPLAG